MQSRAGFEWSTQATKLCSLVKHCNTEFEPLIYRLNQRRKSLVLSYHNHQIRKFSQISNMSDPRTPLLPSRIVLQRGVYTPATSNDVRSPCPIVNSLANHGYISRDGRNIRKGELLSAVNELGLSWVLKNALSRAVYIERDNETILKASRWTRFWFYLTNPLALFFSKFALRRLGQSDTAGKVVINLDQLAIHGAIEHDVSLTRYDHAQGDNHTLDLDLVKDMLASSSDGGKTLTLEDLAKFRKRRIEKQRKINPDLEYGPVQHTLACGELSLILSAFGDGKQISCAFTKALFQEERLPYTEGWKKRSWWTIGIFEVAWLGEKVKRLVSIDT
jgi:hypothetical protein